MMITACLSFFDEPPDLLGECVDRLGRVGVDRLVAVDGPYELYPHACARSSPSSIDAIRQAARESGIALTLVYAERAWKNNEVGKRQRMIEIARGMKPRGSWQSALRERDWLLVVDADHFWEADDDLHRLLYPIHNEQVPIAFARVSFAEVFQTDGTPIYAPARPLVRARWDLRMGANHYTYETDVGYSTFLERPAPTTPALDLTDRVRVIHRVHDRDATKRAHQSAYYANRDELGVES